MRAVHYAVLVLSALLVSVCTASEQQAAQRTAEDVCSVIAPNTDAGIQLFEKLVHDVAELERELAAAAARDAGAREGGRDR